MVEIIESVNLVTQHKLNNALIESIEALSYPVTSMLNESIGENLKKLLSDSINKIKEIIIKIYKLVVAGFKFLYRFLRDGISRLFRMTHGDEKLMKDDTLIKFIKAGLNLNQISKEEFIKSSDKMKKVALEFLKNENCIVAKEVNNFNTYRFKANTAKDITPEDIFKIIGLPQSLFNVTLPVFNAVQEGKGAKISSYMKRINDKMNDFNKNKGYLYDEFGRGIGLRDDNNIFNSIIGVNLLGVKGLQNVIDENFDFKDVSISSLISDEYIKIVPDVSKFKENTIGGFNKFKQAKNLLLNCYADFNYFIMDGIFEIKKGGVDLNISIHDFSKIENTSEGKRAKVVTAKTLNELADIMAKNANILSMNIELLRSDFVFQAMSGVNKTIYETDINEMFRNMITLLKETQLISNAVINVTTIIGVHAKHFYAMVHNLNSAIHYNIEKALKGEADPNIKLITFNK